MENGFDQANREYSHEVVPVDVKEEPLFTARKLKVICVGAGYSGLTVAYKYKYEWKMQGYADLTIYEKNTDVGGTWFENNYPGVGCDVPAHAYSFLFEPNPDWSSVYVKGKEIFCYMRDTVTKYKLDENIQFSSKVIEARWDDRRGKWKIKVQRGGDIIEDEADVFINSTGFLNKWKWPDIAGLHDFQGSKLHSANWDSTVDWRDKRIAIIGNGSSAIQILPQMQKTAKHITTYIRTPTWVCANFAAELTKDGMGGNFKYTDEEKEKFRSDPEALRQHRTSLEHSINTYYFALSDKDGETQATVRKIFEGMMRQRLDNDPELCELLIPSWPVGCRRPTPGDGYLEALQKENVQINSGGIDRITSGGILDKKGEEERFDIVVCATGFDRWSDDPEAYFGTCCPQMPNYFVFIGPNTPIGHGSIFPVIDATAEHALRWVHRIATTGIKSVNVKEDATREYNDYIQAVLKRSTWAGGCRSWYKNGSVNRKITAMYGGSVLHFKQILESFRVEDFDIEYREGNRFRFMGNGFSPQDAEGKNLGYYIR